MRHKVYSWRGAAENKKIASTLSGIHVPYYTHERVIFFAKMKKNLLLFFVKNYKASLGIC